MKAWLSCDLEHFEGVMFPTTNRLTAFDEAILSQIHLPIRFDILDKSAQESVWQRFLKTANASHGVAAIEPNEWETLAERELNGRQVYNNSSVGRSRTEVL